MKFTITWLKQFLEIDASLNEISLALTSLGLEVDEIIDRSAELKDFIVAEILAAEPHPNADKLRVCRVFDGSKELQVVCGAPNARAGIKVVLAPIGAIVPANKLEIKQSKIRDVESQGMLCSAVELKIGNDSSGIIELDANYQVGTPFITASGLDDPIFDLSVTPNRGDCLGVYGIARELAALKLGTLKPLESLPVIDDGTECPIKVETDNNIGCKRLLARFFRGVDNNKKTPDFVTDNLQAVGAKTISPAVDITNWVCMSYGRPSHVYDADKIVGNIKIRKAIKDEKFVALNETEYTMKGGELVISDEEGIISLAGVIGGKRTACDQNTANILLEIAVFDPGEVANSGRYHMIETDSRYRFERKIDENFLQQADFILSAMLLKYCGGTASKNLDRIAQEQSSKRIKYSSLLFARKAGFKLPLETIISLLESLGFRISAKQEDAFEVAVPSFRNDIEIAEDITEEVLRLYGYNNIPSITLLSEGKISKPPIAKKFSVAKQLVRLLAIQGYHELVTWSFMKKEKAEKFAELEDKIAIVNPISVELSYMRPTIIANLLDALKINQERGFSNLSVVEIGPVFSSSHPNLQTKVCAGVRSGFANLKSIHNKAEKFNIFDVKRDLFMLIGECGFDADKMNLVQDKVTPRYYHPSQSAALFMGKNLIAYFGKLHPQILKCYELDMDTYAFELFLDNIPETKSKAGKKIATGFSDYQSVKRDFAFILDKKFPAGSLIKMIEALDKKLIQAVEIFDSFEGSAVGENKKSIALNVTIQARDRTLTEAEIEQLSDRIIAEVSHKAGGVLRR